MTPGRAIRPFPTRDLVAKLGLVQLRVMTLQEELITATAQNGTWDVGQWKHSLFLLQGVLEGICEAAMDAHAQCDELFASARADYERAQRAALAMLRGLEERPKLRVVGDERTAA